MVFGEKRLVWFVGVGWVGFLIVFFVFFSFLERRGLFRFLEWGFDWGWVYCGRREVVEF